MLERGNEQWNTVAVVLALEFGDRASMKLWRLATEYRIFAVGAGLPARFNEAAAVCRGIVHEQQLW